MAYHLLVGDEGATFNEILNTISRSPAFPELIKNWRIFARELQIPAFQVQKMQQSLLLDIESDTEILHNILIQWRSYNGPEATLVRLCESFRRIRMNAIADQLLNKFAPNTNTLNLTTHTVTAAASKPDFGLVFNAAKDEIVWPPRAKITGPKDEITPAESQTIYQNLPAVSFITQQVGFSDIYYYPGKRRLGQGATSLVYQGYFKKVDTLAAVKEIRKKDSDIFDKELDAFKTLMSDQMTSHSNIVRLFGWTDYDDMLYFAMEQATFDLRNFIELNPTLYRKTMLKISNDMVQGLQYLHGKSIIHRDIKSKNILIFENNENPLAKLGDFGTCRKLTSLTSTLTMSKGSEVWMPPEAINAMHDEKPFPNSRALDIFSLGMTLYVTFSKGKHPFEKSKKHGRFPLMNIKDPDVQYIKLEQIVRSEHTLHLLDWMMQKSPRNRPNINQVASHLIWTE